MEPSQVALMPVTFIQDRDGRAVVRLPNGSKTTVDYRTLDAQPLFANFVRDLEGAGVTVSCGERCDWSEHALDWPEALARLAAHFEEAHPEARAAQP